MYNSTVMKQLELLNKNGEEFNESSYTEVINIISFFIFQFTMKRHGMVLSQNAYVIHT